ncbi:hypothetical protein [Aurantibacillus circumpalustris]|uniref:hypothetical protein n=1 Tax=Aurantibacillus circumpalustris TaxID=3036359 RepID=UPI00295B17DB|nr:hypothetical protein [Aurantibacillus circumpalustris]
MVKLFFRKPQTFFFGIALVTLLVAVNYFYYYPEAYFDLGGDFEFSVSCSTCWFAFSVYTLILSGIYYTASKGGVKTRHWLLMSHFIFVILFLLMFFVFSSFNTSYVQDRISGLPFITLIVIYGVIFLLDLIFFAISMILLLLNILSFKKPKS